MPWQSSATLLIVAGCFNAVAGLVGGIHYLSYGVSLILYRGGSFCAAINGKL